MERKLDAIWIGTWKVQVNLPKYRRFEVSRKEWNSKKRAEHPRNVWRPKAQHQKRSYAQIVSGEKASGSQEISRVVQFSVNVESPSWLVGCFVGCLREVSFLQTLKKGFIMGGFSLVRLRYLGERFVLLSCDDAGILGKLVVDNKDWFDGFFSSIFLWDESFAIKERFAWFRCRGIPLQLWNSQCFDSIGALVGEVVEIDDAMLKKEVLEFARFRVKLPMDSSVCSTKEICINSIPCRVTFEEEVQKVVAVMGLSLTQWAPILVKELECDVS
ncbi:hypothetical protein VNO80_05806 [Phaseolus coccineus]|uniref:DUF4283 domain-containing protein n=1 Tax=Phaseolus coccineus TaxID=3886 RepID=A0AAN9NMQ7_PHACN